MGEDVEMLGLVEMISFAGPATNVGPIALHSSRHVATVRPTPIKEFYVPPKTHVFEGND